MYEYALEFGSMCDGFHTSTTHLLHRRCDSKRLWMVEGRLDEAGLAYYEYPNVGSPHTPEPDLTIVTKKIPAYRQLLGTFAPVRVVLDGLRRSRFVDHRLGGQPTCNWGICHLLGKYAVARPVRPQRRPVSRPGEQGFVLDDGLVDQNLHSAFEIVLWLENGFGRIVRL
jgi:hypothetical protein